jgi:HSP20 family molecular chaperone IbpA
MRTRDPTGWMWEEACEMLERAERMQRQFFQVRAEARRGPTWEPPVDIVETGRDLTIVVALPGVLAPDIDVLIEGDMLLVRGARTLPSIPDGAVIHRLEIPHGRFERRIVLQSGRLELTRRELTDGCLLLRFAKLG